MVPGAFLALMSVALAGDAPPAADPAPAIPAHPESVPPDLPAPDGSPTAIVPPAASSPIRFDATWDNGLFLTSEDKQFRFHAGGVAQIDSTWLIGPQGNFVAKGGAANGVGNAAATELRRAVLQIDGTMYGQFDYMIQYDFANASNDNSGLEPPSFGNIATNPAPQNIWMQVRDIPYLGIVRIGNQNKPIGMTTNTGAANLSFMERPDNNDAFYGPFDNGYALGVTVINWAESERATWQSGIYRPSTNVFGVTLNKGAFGGRVTALPIYEDEGEELVHVGLGSFGGELVQDDLRDRARPLLRNGPGYAVPVLLDTGDIPGNRQYTVGPEFAAVFGSLTVQAEWAGQWLTNASPNGQNVGTIFYQGGYVEALYFLTGEHAQYQKHEGVFGRVIPRSNFSTKAGDGCRGLGAWQVGVRFSYLDLTDKSIQGGQLYDWTVGVNWYLNPNMKIQFNYIAEHRDDPPAGVNGWINGVGMRASYDF
jgi:phosphate-selective porin OprO/OprP